MGFKLGELTKLIVARENPSSLENAARTAVAAIASYLVARLVRLPEAYWATVSTIVVTQSSMGASLPVSVQRFFGTAIGAVAGAIAASLLPGDVWAFGFALLAIGILCAVLRTERSAYRYAGITLAIVMLIPRPTNVWVIALHRFSEVSIGIVVGLAVSAAWPESKRKGRDTIGA